MAGPGSSHLEETRPLLANQARHEHAPMHPRTVTRVVTRIQALTLELLPIQVDLDELTSPVSSILTKEVVEAYSKIAGDFSQCLPFALLEARRYFKRQAYLNPSDSDENAGRALACEALARKIVAVIPMAEQYTLLSARFTIIEADGDESLPLSVLESAVDQHATFFLSSGEAQRTVFALWKGLLVQTVKETGSIEYEPYSGKKSLFFGLFDPTRVAVPRYMFVLRIILWFVFVINYTLAIQTPDRAFGVEDIFLYIQLAGYILEDIVKVFKIGVWSSLGFWWSVNVLIYTLLGIAFGYRIADLATHNDERALQFRILSFQFLASASPLIWAKLVTVFDVLQFMGTLQIVVWRMLKESAVFFFLLGLLAIGFGQALTGLDTAQDTDATEPVIHSLIQGLLGSPVFDLYERGANSYPFGMILYYAWTVMTIVILLNILIALFGSAYSECTDEAVPTFMAFFAGKTISAIRAPDTFVYVAPANLIEIVILPLEFVLSRKTYARLNHILMGFIFFIPLCIISLFESYFDQNRAADFEALTTEPDEFGTAEEDPEPCRTADELGEADDEDREISRVSFEELKKALPSLTRSVSGEILWEIKQLKKELAELKAAQKSEK